MRLAEKRRIYAGSMTALADLLIARRQMADSDTAGGPEKVAAVSGYATAGAAARAAHWEVWMIAPGEIARLANRVILLSQDHYKPGKPEPKASDYSKASMQLAASMRADLGEPLSEEEAQLLGRGTSQGQPDDSAARGGV